MKTVYLPECCRLDSGEMIEAGWSKMVYEFRECAFRDKRQGEGSVSLVATWELAFPEFAPANHTSASNYLDANEALMWVCCKIETQRQSLFIRQSYTRHQCTSVHPEGRFWSLWTTKIPWREAHLTHWASEHSSHALCPWKHRLLRSAFLHPKSFQVSQWQKKHVIFTWPMTMCIIRLSFVVVGL